MSRSSRRDGSVPWLLASLAALLTVLATGAAAGGGDAAPTDGELHERVLRGRKLVIAHGCGDCHGGMPNPASDHWLVGKSAEGEAEQLGPFTIYPRNLTPDVETGLGAVSERQIFNALRYGLRPSRSPDVEITSSIPGEGNHPVEPDYLAPAMPWVYFRYMTDRELWDIASYLKHGLNPVRHRVPDTQGPPDRWASEFAPDRIGPPEVPAFPTAHEELRDESRREQVLHGRHLVATMACSVCHGGALHPGKDGWLSGSRGEGPLQVFRIGPFTTLPRNLTPDNSTGMGRFTERQIFNALRFGLRPGETPDVEITSTVPGEGNHPVSPKYMAVPMPWPAWRHLADEELWAIAAYLKYGVRPVSHRVADSEGPPDFWASEYTPDKVGAWPAPPFPTARERSPVAAAGQ